MSHTKPCSACKGEGKNFWYDKCRNCNGTGKVDVALEAAVVEEARVLLNFLYPYIKGNLFDADTARAKIQKALWDGVNRGRREENESCHDALDYSDFIEYCKKLGQEPSGALVLAASQAYKYAKSTIRARMGERK